ncbi:hypothetical protein K435DRAFT_762382 [Dendrothele bispora CBS 962.96]|uniref:Uncharacterized protein n=1 Tax=Dendrothele bispora (strain CBS 962.96) TaxID=1314807 RepID=A0A4S8LFF9_DENBC|nr:hypothetical protein K435DRAFT_762382 [Dendrothele bispora CBS 962.96]
MPTSNGPISVEVAYLWGIIISTFLFGVYVVLFGIAMYILLLPLSPAFNGREPVNKTLITVSICMVLVCTLHFVVQCIRLHKGYVQRIRLNGTIFVEVGSEEDGTIPYLEDIAQPLAIVTGICFTIAALLTDGLTIYRLYIIWGRKLSICILPTITLVGMIVCGFVMCAVTLDMEPPRVKLFGTLAAKWLVATFIIGLTTNFVALGAISWKFWTNSRDKKAGSIKGVNTTMRTVFVVLVESTAIYSGTKFINLMLLLAETNVAYTFFCIVIPMIGIASHLLIIHVGYEKYFRHVLTGESSGVTDVRSGNTRRNTQIRIRIPSRLESSAHLPSPMRSLFRDDTDQTSSGMGTGHSKFHSSEIEMETIRATTTYPRSPDTFIFSSTGDSETSKMPDKGW